jgi:hypothetical protein
MVARIAVFPIQPDRFDETRYRWVIETIREAHGFVAAYHVVDRANGDSISISIFDSAEDARAAEAKVGKARLERGAVASPPDEVRFCDVLDRTVA